MIFNDSEDYINEFNAATERLKKSGADLAKIRITLKKDSMPSYITRRIHEEMMKERGIEQC